MDAEKVLEQVAREVTTCQRCGLHHSRKRAVPGEGPANAEIMFIGEGPGFYENEQGRPFVGAAGKFLDELLTGIGMKREQVFIGNVVKCRPPGNRDPQPEEIEACVSNYLERQIQAINPKVIVTLGRFSMGLFLRDAKISTVHGQSMWVKGRLIVPMYHPAAALHQQSLRPELVKDFARLPDLIARAMPASQEKISEQKPVEEQPKKDPKQLTLF
ncbi:MAG: uracil-DNA glycosylase [Chloroflexota bacterium]|nr:MAG: uracil-DNA glycosylase [Chloroflexota bacterium]